MKNYKGIIYYYHASIKNIKYNQQLELHIHTCIFSYRMIMKKSFLFSLNKILCEQSTPVQIT